MHGLQEQHSSIGSHHSAVAAPCSGLVSNNGAWVQTFDATPPSATWNGFLGCPNKRTSSRWFQDLGKITHTRYPVKPETHTARSKPNPVILPILVAFRNANHLFTEPPNNTSCLSWLANQVCLMSCAKRSEPPTMHSLFGIPEILIDRKLML